MNYICFQRIVILALNYLVAKDLFHYMNLTFNRTAKNRGRCYRVLL